MRPITCEELRARLERACGQSRPLQRDASWHEHLLGCVDCRAFLRREGALDEVLDALDGPSPPEGLAGRVLASLAGERSEASGKPVGLLAGESDERLDELLGLLPAEAAPRGLARRVLARLAGERPPSMRKPRRILALAAAGLVLAAALALRGWHGRPLPLVEERVAANAGVPDADLENDEELVSYALEQWDLLTSADLDLWLGGLDPEDELLIEFSDGSPGAPLDAPFDAEEGSPPPAPPLERE